MRIDRERRWKEREGGEKEMGKGGDKGGIRERKMRKREERGGNRRSAEKGKRRGC